MPDPLQTPLVVVDRTVCIGSGMCIVYAPASFEHDDEAKAVVRMPLGDPLEAIRNAVEACPTGALSLSTTEQEV